MAQINADGTADIGQSPSFLTLNSLHHVVFRAMSSSPNLSCSSDCSTQIIIDQQNKQDNELNIFENNFRAKNEWKEIVLSSKVALH